MPAPDAGIYVLLSFRRAKDVDARNTSAHDG
jgi:hypothetical protein